MREKIRGRGENGARGCGRGHCGTTYGRSIAGSMSSGRLVAAMTKTLLWRSGLEIGSRTDSVSSSRTGESTPTSAQVTSGTVARPSRFADGCT